MFVYNDHIAETVADISRHVYIRHKHIVHRLAVLVSDRQLILRIGTDAGAVVQHTDGADRINRGIIVQGIELRLFVFVPIQVVDFFPSLITRTDAVSLEPDLAPFVPYTHIVQLQVGVGQVINNNLRSTVSFQPAFAVQVA